MYYAIKMRSDAIQPRVIGFHNLRRKTRIRFTLVARNLLIPVAQKLQMRTWGFDEQNVCSSFSVTSHQNRLLFMKHSAIPVVIRAF